MKIIQKEDVQNILLSKRGGLRGVQSIPQYIYKINQLEIGEGLVIKKDEWKLKTTLSISISASVVLSKKKFSTRLLLNKDGWLVKRLS